MSFIKNIFSQEIFRQFVKFGLVGIVNTIIDYGVYLLLTRILSLYIIYANMASVFVAMTFSFFANKFWTFQNKDKQIKKQYLQFALVNGVYFLLYNAIFFSLVNYLQIYDLLAKVIAIGIGLFWNFFANRYWTFKSTKY